MTNNTPHIVDFTGSVSSSSEHEVIDEAQNEITTDIECPKADDEALPAENPDSKGDVESQTTEVTATNNDEPTVTIVTDLNAYKGITLEEKIDAFVSAHPVVMFQKTWCLFSIDAQSFLVDQMRVSVHTMELDLHPQGKAIQRYIKKKTKHPTVPVIFIKGEFLGGYDEVNKLYAEGKLDSVYLQGLTQADQCEQFITKSNIHTRPLFWFPETVNAHVVRATGILTSLLSASSAIIVYWFDGGRYIAYFLFFDFILRFFAGSRISVLGNMATWLVKPIDPKPRKGRPKQFATMCGVMFSGLGSLFFFLSFPYHDIVGIVFMGGLAGASGMEGFLDFCVGCVIFKYGIKLGLIPK